MKFMKYNSNLLCSLVALDTSKKFAAKGLVKNAVEVAEKALKIEDGPFMGEVRGELKAVVESFLPPTQ